MMAASKEVVSRSLIRIESRVALSKEDGKRFCLEMPGWCPCDECSAQDFSTVESAPASSVEESVYNDFNWENDVKKSLID